MEEQIQELKWQRDVAQSRVENLLKSTAEERSSSSSMEDSRRKSYDSTEFDEPRMLTNLGKSNFYSPDEDGFLLEDTTPQFSGQDLYGNGEEMAERATQEPEDACKEVRCIEENSGEAEKVKFQDSQEDIREKKVESYDEQNHKSFVAGEKAENEAMELKKEDADSPLKTIDMELSLYAKLDAQDELTINKLVQEVQETEQFVEKQRQSPKKEDMEQSLSKDQSYLEHKQNYKSFVADENEAMESKKEDLDSSIKQIDMELSLHPELEAGDDLTTNKLVQEDKETEKQSQSSKKEDMKQNSSKEKSKQYVQEDGDSDKDDNTYEALKKKVKEMQKTIEYFMSMQSAEEKQSPSFSTIDDNTSPGGDYFNNKMRRSRSCRENLLFTNAVAAAATGRFTFKTSTNTSFDSDNTASFDAQSTKDSDTDTSSSSFHEFIAGLKERTMQHHYTPEADTETKKTKPQNADDSGAKAEFERQQSQIIELWEVCNVPLVHRTYSFLLFKGDPTDFVYMEVELRRLSFLKDSPETSRKQTAKAVAREREWLAKQIPKKFGKKEREEVYKKWGVELNSKQRSLQVSHKMWINSNDIEVCKESASLVATLVGFVDSNLTPKEMFGLSFSPTTPLNVKSSGWSISNSFSRISLT